MDVQDLQVFREVVQHASVQSAAKALGMPRTTLRRKIEQLEAEIGEPLLQRGVEGVKLTPAGEVVLARSRRVLAELDELLAEARSLSHQGRGQLRMITPVGMPDGVRVRLLGSLVTLYPNIRVSTRETEDPLSLLEEPFELLVHYGPPPEGQTWFSRVLRRVRLGCLATPAYLERAGTPERAEQLVDHTLLALRVPGFDTSNWPLLMGGSIPVEPNFCTSNMQLLRAATVEGLGISFGTIGDVSDFDLEHKLVPVLPDTIGAATTVRVLSPHPSSFDPHTRVVMQTIQQQLSRLPSD